MSDTDGRSWEPRLRELLNGIFSRRLDPLASELNALQGTLDGLRARLADEARAAEKEALEVFAAEARGQLEASEKDFAGEREVLRGRYELSFKTERALLNAVIANIDRQRTQAGVLAATILGASTFASRVALFVVRSGSIVGWRGAGFGQETDEASLALLSVPLAGRSLVADAVNRRQSVLTSNSTDPGDLAFLGALRLNGAASAAIPLIVRDKPAAVLYADSTREDGIDVQPLEAIVRVASLAIELLPLRRSIEHFTTELPAPRVLTSSLDVSGVTDEIADVPSEATAPTADQSLPTAPLPSSFDPAVEPPEESSTADIEANGHVATGVSVDDPAPVPTVASESAVNEVRESPFPRSLRQIRWSPRIRELMSMRGGTLAFS